MSVVTEILKILYEKDLNNPDSELSKAIKRSMECPNWKAFVKSTKRFYDKQKGQRYPMPKKPSDSK